MNGVEYLRPLTESAGRVQFNQMMLMNDDDVRTMFSIFGQYSTKGTIELESSLFRFIEENQKSLLRLRNNEDIRVLLEEPDEELN